MSTLIFKEAKSSLIYLKELGTFAGAKGYGKGNQKPYSNILAGILHKRYTGDSIVF
ncbi:hypothetical protein Avbf_16797, partial [Armadillidium vulgare]